MLKAVPLQPLVPAPAIAHYLTAGLDFGVEKSVQAAGRRVGDDRQSRKRRNRFLALLAGSATFHRDRHHRLGFGSSSLLGLTLFRSAHVAFVDFDQALPTIALIAVRWPCESYAASAKRWGKRHRSPGSVAARKSLSCPGSCGRSPTTSSGGELGSCEKWCPR